MSFCHSGDLPDRPSTSRRRQPRLVNLPGRKKKKKSKNKNNAEKQKKTQKSKWRKRQGDKGFFNRAGGRLHTSTQKNKRASEAQDNYHIDRSALPHREVLV